MIYCSIDLETCGLDPKEDTVIEFGCIIEDTKKQLPFESIPKFNVLLEHTKYTGTPYALALHKTIFEDLEKKHKSTVPIIPSDLLGQYFYEWLKSQPEFADDFVNLPTSHFPIKLNVAGKNFGTFDMQFLENLKGFKNWVWFKQRIIDPAVFYFNNDLDMELPNLKNCKIRANCNEPEVAHRTLRDAMDVVELLRGKLYPLLKTT